MKLNSKDIIQIRLLKENYKAFPPKSEYSMKYVDKNNFLEYDKDIKIVLDLINEELSDWELCPDYQTIVDRFDADSHCLLFYYNNRCIGWNWGNPKVCIDWITPLQDLKANEVYGGGCYVSRLVARPPHAGLYNYNLIFDYWIYKLGYDTVYGYIDSWNKAAIRVNWANGLHEFNYMNL